MTPAERDAFILAHTRLRSPPHLPELRLHLTDAMTALWEMTEEALDANGLPPPFWAFAWAGGQALARYLLDHPATVAGLRVLDVGTGSGLVAIAALKAGAASARGVDVDAFAVASAALNARANAVPLELACADILDGDAGDAQVVLAGDLAYEQPASDRVRAFLRRAHDAGARVLIGDPGRVYFSAGGLVQRAEYDIPTDTEIEELQVKRTRVWEMV